MAQENKKIIAAPKGSSKHIRRVGRGQGSGWGCTAGRGNKGAQSRSGYSRRVGFEGGQMPLVRRIPKYGFTNAPFKKDVEIININQLINLFDEAEITKEMLIKKGILTKANGYVKLLSNGNISKAITITVDMASKSAIKKIEDAGGKVIITERKKWVREKANKKS